MTKRFYNAIEAAEYASTLTSNWLNETDNVVSDYEMLSKMSGYGNGSADDDGYSYYLVTEKGSIGATTDGGNSFCWLFKACEKHEKITLRTQVTYTHSKVCAKCGAPLFTDALFCHECGTPINDVVATSTNNAVSVDNVRVDGGGANPVITDYSNQSTTITKTTEPITAAVVSDNDKTETTKEKRHLFKRSNKKDESSVHLEGSAAEKHIKSKATESYGGVRGGVGYSKVIENENFLRSVAKNKKSSKITCAIIILLPVIALTVLSLFSPEVDVVDGIIIGGAISLFFFVVYFIASLKDVFAGSWEGVVIKKTEKNVRVSTKHGGENDRAWQTHYITVIKSNSGKTVKIDERDPIYYSYLKVDDRVRYHGKMGFAFPYEKYDKSNDEYVICAFCGHKAPIKGNKCPHCRKTILK